MHLNLSRHPHFNTKVFLEIYGNLISGNHLTSDSEDISALLHLVHLNLSNNFVTSIPHQEAIFA